MSPEAAIRVQQRPERYRFVAEVDGVEAGVLTYRDADDGVRTFIHTEVDPAFEGHGIAGMLARAGLDDARSRGVQIVPLCPYVNAWIARHPDYSDLVD